jgi:hypothetical protein
MRKVNYFTLALACFQIAAYSQTVPYPGDGPSVYIVRVISVGSAEKDAFVACLKAVEPSVLRITKNPPPPMFPAEGCVTAKAIAIAIAASAALPPDWSTFSPTWAALGSWATTMPCFARTGWWASATNTNSRSKPMNRMAAIVLEPEFEPWH